VNNRDLTGSSRSECFAAEAASRPAKLKGWPRPLPGIRAPLEPTLATTGLKVQRTPPVVAHALPQIPAPLVMQPPEA
jgi:hypothetical protein